MAPPEQGWRRPARLLLLLCVCLPLSLPAPAAQDPAMDEVEALIRVRDYAAAAARLRPLAETGSAEAQYRLAGLYRAGKGVGRDLERAIDLYLDAAQAGYADAQYALALILEKSADSPASRREARHWYRQAAAQGNAQAGIKLEQMEEPTQSAERQLGRADIFTAIQHNDEALIDSLLARKVDLDLTDRHGNSTVMAALLADRPRLANILLKATGNVEQPNALGSSPLHVAATRGYRDAVIDLIYAGAELDRTDARGNTALMLAVANRHTGIAELLLEVGADPLIVNDKKQSAADLAYASDDAQGKALFAGLGLAPKPAAEERETLSIGEFKARAARQGKRYAGWPLLNIAIEQGEGGVVDRLLAQQPDTRARGPDGNTALHVAARGGERGIVERLLRSDIDIDAVNRRGETALYLAADAGCLDCVRRLLERGADPAIASRLEVTPLEIAVQKKHPKTAHALLQSKARYPGIHRVLLLAVEKKMENLAVALIRRDPELTRLDEHGRSVLWYGADQGLAKAVDALARSGKFELDRRDKNGYSPLAQAAYRGHFDSVQALMRRGAATDTLTAQKNSPLMLAALSGNARLVRHLIDAGAAIDAQNDIGDTALMMAASRGHIDVVERLIEAGADLELRNREQLNALRIANDSGHPKIAALIRENSNPLLRLFD